MYLFLILAITQHIHCYFMHIFSSFSSDMPRSVSMESAASGRSSVSASSSSYNELYPDTDHLLRLAQQVQAKRGDVTNTATDMLQSADTVSQYYLFYLLYG